MAVATLVGVSAYVGLAVLAWGGWVPFFSDPARVALVIVTAGLTAAAIASPGNLSRGEREDRGNRWVIAALTILGLLIGFMPAYTDRHEKLHRTRRLEVRLDIPSSWAGRRWRSTRAEPVTLRSRCTVPAPRGKARAGPSAFALCRLPAYHDEHRRDHDPLRQGRLAS